MDWIFRAKVVHVIDYETAELRFDLGFNIFKRKQVKISGYFVDDSQQKKAKDCLIVLIGGHRVIAKMEKVKDLWTASLFMYQQVKIKDVIEIIQEKRLPCVNRIMLKAREKEFDPEWLKTMFKGAK